MPTVLSRRSLLVGAGAVPVATLLGATAADAKPIVLSDSTKRAHGPVMQIGDSLSGGYVGGLSEELVARRVGPFRCDIQGSRSITREPNKRYPSGLTAVRSARAAGFDPPAWVVALGCNDMWFIARKPGVATEMVDRILTEIGSDRHVYFLDYWQKQKGAWPKFNDALLAATARWPNLRIANWSTLAKQHPEWHGPDGAHYTGKGAKARNTYLVDTMIKAAKAAASRPRRTVRAGRPSLSGRPHVA